MPMCGTPSGHRDGLRPWIRTNGWGTANDLNPTLDFEHAHVRATVLMGFCDKAPNDFFRKDDVAALLGVRDRRQASFPGLPVTNPLVGICGYQVEGGLQAGAGAVDCRRCQCRG